MAPRTEEQNQAAREESRARILQSALELFARTGYERTSVQMIARQAGVSQGLMYRYFASKQHLLREVFLLGMHDVQESFARAAEAADPRERLEHLLRASFEVVQRHSDFWRLSLSIRMQPAALEGLAEDVAAWRDDIRRMLEAHLQAPGVADPATEAVVLFALIDGMVQHYLLDPQHYPLDAAVAAVVARYAS
jgi:AcrR family transcriptional regulator